MITWFTRNSVAANLLMICIITAGLYSLVTQLTLEIFPSTESEVVRVSVSLRGATPEDVEQGISIKIEQALQGLDGIEKLVSRSAEGSASVSVYIDEDYDPQILLNEIKNRVDGINTFPIEAEKPNVALAQRLREVITVTLSSIHTETEVRQYAEQIYDELLQSPDISQLELTGVRNYEIAVEISQQKLQQYQLSLDDVARIIRNSSVDVSSGNLKTQGGDVLIRSKGQGYHKDDFTKIVIKTNNDGSKITLNDIATIHDGFEETPVRVRFNGNSAVFIDVYRTGPQSAIGVAEAVRTYIDNKQSSLPNGYHLSYWDDDSTIVKNRLSTLLQNALQGSILVLALLTLFLRPSIAFWVFIGIPVSFMGAFLVMPLFGATLNILSLFGFILVLGIVVDDAIVTGENIYTHLRSAESGETAAILGTKEVSVPVTFGILTTIAAFLPLAYIEGSRSIIYEQIPIVVIPVLLFSLIESKLVLPSHLKHLKLRREKQQSNAFVQFQQRFADGFEQAILRHYKPLLVKAINHKLSVLMAFICVFALIYALISSGWSKFIFFPKIPSETIRLNLTMPPGTPFEITNKHIVYMEEQAVKLQQKYTDSDTDKSLIIDILASTGGRSGASHIGGVRMALQPPEERSIDISVNQIVKEWRQLIKNITGAEELSFRAEIGRSSDPIDIQLSSNSLNTLERVSSEVKQLLNNYNSVFDITDSLSRGKDELQIELTDNGIALGLTRLDIASQVRSAFFGTQVQRIQRGRDDVRLMVRLPLAQRQSLASLQKLLIKTPSGNFVPLSHLATLTPGKSPTSIYRIDRYRTVSVRADIDKNSVNMTVFQRELNEKLATIIDKYPGVNYSLEGEAKEQRESFGSLSWSLVAVLFAIYILLAIPFKSYFDPLVVMSIIPFSIMGSVMGHWLMGMDLTIMSLLGMLALMGVVVNDSLMVVDTIKKKRQAGQDMMSAVLTAGVARFRPVILTSLTTFIGLIPLLFEQSTQAQFMIPMAVSLAFGILFATLIILFLVPVNYLLAAQLKQFIGLKP